MNEIVTSARSAREKLAAALALLQSPDAGDIIDKVAEPVARAMGALHGIETSGGQSAADGGPKALAAVREALGAMQSVELSNASLELAASQIAGSLGLVHGLAQAAAAAPKTAQPQGFASSAPKASTPASPNFAKTTPSVAPPAEANFAKTSPSVTPSVSAAQRGNPSVPAAPAGAGAFDKTAMASRSPVAHLDTSAQKAPTAPMEAPAPVIHRASAQPSTAQATRSGDSKHAPAPSHGPSHGTPIVEANLGAHSPTNFYKGLSGNDVIVDGGLFVATYQIPPIGAKVWLKVTMPGGYDFEAGALVRWSRDTGVGDAPPGFGAALSDLSPEAKQLIYRYVRNREPLFHDDM